MNMLLLKLLRRNRLMKPAGDDGSDAGGTTTVIDRGDDFQPTDDDAATAAAAAKVDAQAAADAEAAEVEAALAAEAEKAKGAEKPKEKVKAPGAEAENDDDDDKDVTKGKMIPLARHKAMLERDRQERDAMARELAQYRQGAAVKETNAEIAQQETAIIDMEKQYNALLADGDVEKASAMMTKIRQAERAVSEAKSDAKLVIAEARAVERTRYGIALERIEAAYPTLNPDHEDFDAALMEDVADLKTTYERKGLTPTAAMQKAVTKLVGADTAKQKSVTTVTPNVPAPAAPEDKGGKTADEIAAERKQAAVAATRAALGKTPPSTTKVGLDSDKAGGALTAKDVMKLSHEDFIKLPDDVLAKMRGDTV